MITKPHIDQLKEGPCRGMWRCKSNGQTWHPGACFGATPSAAYQAWVTWQEHCKTQPLAFLRVAA